MSELRQYLEAKGFDFKRIGQSDTANRCPFCGDERWKFSCNPDPEKPVYQCFICGVKGNLTTLKRHFNDLDNPAITSFNKVIKREYKTPPADDAEKFHLALFEKQHAFDYLRKRGLTLGTIQKFKLGYMKDSVGEWISIPYYQGDKLINFKFRTLPPDKKFKRIKDAPSALFNQNCLKEAAEVLITEGEFDAMMCWQSGFKNVVSGSNGAGSFEPEWIDQLQDLKKIYLWYDNDDPGRKGMDEVINRLGIDRCWIIQEEGFKDANEYFLCHSSYDFSQAKQKKLENVIHFWESVFKIFEHEKKLSSEIKTPWDNVNRLLGNIENGDLITLSATPKTGKTSMALNLATYNAKRKYPVLFYCLEMRPERLAKKIVQAEGLLSVEEFTREKALKVAERLYDMPLHFGYNYKNIDVETVFQTIRAATSRYGIKLVVFDHLHFLVRSIAHVSAEVGNVTRSFKLLAEELHIPIILIAQPRKVEESEVMTMNDLKDSASIGADSDQVVILWRKKTKANPKSSFEQESSYEPRTLVRVDASRHTPGGDTFLHFQGEYSLFTGIHR